MNVRLIVPALIASLYAGASLAAGVISTPTPSSTPIAGLFNTGVNNLGQPVTSVADSHYSFSVVANAAAYSSGTAIAAGTYTPFSAGAGTYIPSMGAPTGASGRWISAGNSAYSSWITPFQNQNASLDPNSDGHYKFTTSFFIDSTHFNVSSATLSGRWAADNYGSLYLNNHLLSTIANPRTSGASDGVAYNQWNSFSAVSGSSYFLSGLNVLSFDVTNIGQHSGNPAGLRAEFTSSITAVPEPETYAMLLAGLALMGGIARRRRQN
jgi:hypothetical protein